MLPSSLPSRHPRAAFTLIELLTVIAIIGILAAILIPTVGAVRGKAQSAKTVSNLRQIQAANLAYAADSKGFFFSNYTDGSLWNPGWFAYRPYLTYLGVNGAWFGPNNNELPWAWQDQGHPMILRAGRPVPFQAGGDVIFTIAMNTTSWTHRADNGMSIPSSAGWSNWGWWTPGKIASDKVALPSRLIMFYEASDRFGAIHTRNDWVRDDGTPQQGLAYRNNGYANVVFADGSVGRFKKSDMETDSLEVRRHWWVYGGAPGETN